MLYHNAGTGMGLQNCELSRASAGGPSDENFSGILRIEMAVLLQNLMCHYFLFFKFFN